MFIPKRILFMKGSLDYQVGRQIHAYFKDNSKVEIIELGNHGIKKNIPGDDISEFYRHGKRTLVVGIRRGMKFQSCKPSAHYQLPLLSGCIGQCEYCYLNTNLGDRPYMRVNVNVDEILEQAGKNIEERLPEVTIFEGSATSDPIPVEPYTHSLKQAIQYFSKTEKGRFRFVTKYTDVDTLLDVNHGGHTEVRFTLNTDRVIQDFENGTPLMSKRIEAARKIMSADYPTGFLIAPVFLYDHWQDDYKNLLLELKDIIPKNTSYPVTFEVISHRYTPRAKNIITKIFPDTKLPMEDEERTYKYGQFGYGKYTYRKEEVEEIKSFFKKEIPAVFPDGVVKYII